VAAAGLVTFVVIWLVHGYIYRWPSTRTTDAEIDARLTRLAWPGLIWRRRFLAGFRPSPKRSFVRRITEVHPDE
jgi:lipid A 4'-phosphatase